MTSKSDRNKSSLFFIILILFYIVYSIVDTKLNYYEIRYKTTAIVVNMYTEYKDGINRELNYLHVEYGDYDYGGIIRVNRPTYNMINVGDTIIVKVYEKYRKSDNANIECRLSFIRVLEDV